MRANLRVASDVGLDLDADFDCAAVRRQTEMMRRCVLIEPHRGGAASLQIGVLLKLAQMFVVRDAGRHRVVRILRGGGGAAGRRENEREY